jgi:hypothetical protein
MWGKRRRASPVMVNCAARDSIYGGGGSRAAPRPCRYNQARPESCQAAGPAVPSVGCLPTGIRLKGQMAAAGASAGGVLGRLAVLVVLRLAVVLRRADSLGHLRNSVRDHRPGQRTHRYQRRRGRCEGLSRQRGCRTLGRGAAAKPVQPGQAGIMPSRPAPETTRRGVDSVSSPASFR